MSTGRWICNGTSPSPRRQSSSPASAATASSRRSFPAWPYLGMGGGLLLFTAASSSVAGVSRAHQARTDGSPELFVAHLHPSSWAGREKPSQHWPCTAVLAQLPCLARPQPHAPAARRGFSLTSRVPVPPGPHRQQRHRRCEVHALHPPVGLRDVPKRACHSVRGHGHP